jgi:hypothetical protein
MQFNLAFTVRFGVDTFLYSITRQHSIAVARDALEQAQLLLTVPAMAMWGVLYSMYSAAAVQSRAARALHSMKAAAVVALQRCLM